MSNHRSYSTPKVIVTTDETKNYIESKQGNIDVSDLNPNLAKKVENLPDLDAPEEQQEPVDWSGKINELTKRLSEAESDISTNAQNISINSQNISANSQNIQIITNALGLHTSNLDMHGWTWKSRKEKTVNSIVYDPEHPEASYCGKYSYDHYTTLVRNDGGVELEKLLHLYLGNFEIVEAMDEDKTDPETGITYYSTGAITIDLENSYYGDHSTVMFTSMDGDYNKLLVPPKAKYKAKISDRYPDVEIEMKFGNRICTILTDCRAYMFPRDNVGLYLLPLISDVDIPDLEHVQDENPEAMSWKLEKRYQSWSTNHRVEGQFLILSVETLVE